MKRLQRCISQGRVRIMLWTIALLIAATASASGQSVQQVDVVIKDYKFVTKQVPLQPNMPILITIRNEDMVRHDFGSNIFHGTPTQVESQGVISYGRDIGGVYVDPERGAAIRFTLDRPGRFRFRCSIHADMEGELLMMSIGAV